MFDGDDGGVAERHLSVLQVGVEADGESFGNAPFAPISETWRSWVTQQRETRGRSATIGGDATKRIRPGRQARWSGRQGRRGGDRDPRARRTARDRQRAPGRPA